MPSKSIRVSKPYTRVAPSDGRRQTAVNYFYSDRPGSYFQVIKDTEPGNYSIHFKTNRGDYNSKEVQDLVNSIIKDLPDDANLATWGTVSKGGFSGLHRFQDAGMSPTGEYRRLSFKDPSIISEKYGVTLNTDGTVN